MDGIRVLRPDIAKYDKNSVTLYRLLHSFCVHRDRLEAFVIYFTHRQAIFVVVVLFGFCFVFVFVSTVFQTKCRNAHCRCVETALTERVSQLYPSSVQGRAGGEHQNRTFLKPLSFHG